MYQITEKVITLEGCDHVVYGICGNDILIDDISPDFTKVCTLVDALNKENPDPIHIYDIVEDFLAFDDF